MESVRVCVPVFFRHGRFPEYKLGRRDSVPPESRRPDLSRELAVVRSYPDLLTDHFSRPPLAQLRMLMKELEVSFHDESRDRHTFAAGLIVRPFHLVTESPRIFGQAFT